MSTATIIQEYFSSQVDSSMVRLRLLWNKNNYLKTLDWVNLYQQTPEDFFEVCIHLFRRAQRHPEALTIIREMMKHMESLLYKEEDGNLVFSAMHLLPGLAYLLSVSRAYYANNRLEVVKEVIASMPPTHFSFAEYWSLTTRVSGWTHRPFWIGPEFQRFASLSITGLNFADTVAIFIEFLRCLAEHEVQVRGHSSNDDLQQLMVKKIRETTFVVQSADSEKTANVFTVITLFRFLVNRMVPSEKEVPNAALITCSDFLNIVEDPSNDEWTIRCFYDSEFLSKWIDRQLEHQVQDLMENW